ncbi:MAG: hypothetical protein AAGE96_03975 [Cyanobacteria bacterium P01_G01_bin.19]
MDDLLAQLKSEFEPERKSRNKAQQKSAGKPQNPPQKNRPIDRMLDELRVELESGRGRPNRDLGNSTSFTNSGSQASRDAAKNRDRLNTLIDQDYEIQARKREAKLAEIKRQEEARLAAEKRRQQELIEAQRLAELRERRRQEALRDKALVWLKKLNPTSEEGRWFEEFSYSYEDKLQAAIDYLEAMRESGL